MIPERELESLRAAQADWMPMSMTQRRRVYDGDNDMEPIKIADDVPCRVAPGYGHWAPLADRYQGIVPFVITVPHNWDIIDSDQLIDDSGNVYEVRAVKGPTTYATARQVLADQVAK